MSSYDEEDRDVGVLARIRIDERRREASSDFTAALLDPLSTATAAMASSSHYNSPELQSLEALPTVVRAEIEPKLCIAIPASTQLESAEKVTSSVTLCLSTSSGDAQPLSVDVPLLTARPMVSSPSNVLTESQRLDGSAISAATSASRGGGREADEEDVVFQAPAPENIDASEKKRASLCDFADEEAAAFADDHRRRMRENDFLVCVHDHNQQVRENRKCFFDTVASALKAAAVALDPQSIASSEARVLQLSQPPATDAFQVVDIPRHIVDPITSSVMTDPVLFLGKHLMDLRSAEALVFRLFSALMRCNAIGATKRREFFAYCPEGVLLSSVARHFFRHMFGHDELYTPNPTVLTEVREWQHRLLVLFEDIRTAFEERLVAEAGGPRVAASPPPAMQRDSSVNASDGIQIHVGVLTITSSRCKGGDATEGLQVAAQRNKAMRDASSRQWATLDDMWRVACEFSTKQRHRKGQTKVKERRSLSVVAKPPPAGGGSSTVSSPDASPRRKSSSAVRLSLNAAPTQASVSDGTGGAAPAAAVPIAENIGVGITGTAAVFADEVQRHDLVVHEEAVRSATSAQLLQEHLDGVADIATMQQLEIKSILTRGANRVVGLVGSSVGTQPLTPRVPTRRVSNATGVASRIGSAGTTASSQRGARADVALACPRNQADNEGLATLLHQRRKPQPLSTCRHLVAVPAGANHRPPHHLQLDVGLSGKPMLRPNVASAAQSPLVGSTNVSPRSRDTVEEPQVDALVDATARNSRNEFNDICVALSSTEGLLNALRGGPLKSTRLVQQDKEERHQPSASSHEADPHDHLTREEKALVGAVMAFYQDSVFFDQVLDFSAPWFVELEARALVWAEAHFNNLAEQQALARQVAARQHLYSRTPLRPATCAVSGPARPKLQSQLLLHTSPPRAASARIAPPATKSLAPRSAKAAREVQRIGSLDARPEAAKENSRPRLSSGKPERVVCDGVRPSSLWRSKLVTLVGGPVSDTDAAADVVKAGEASSPTLLRERRDVRNYGPEKLRPKTLQAGPSSRYVDEDCIPSERNREIPTDQLKSELERLYLTYDEKVQQQEVLRRRELGAYYFERVMFPEELAEQGKRRQDAVCMQLAKTKASDLLRLNESKPKVTPAVVSQHRQDLIGPIVVPTAENVGAMAVVRPFSSCVSARHWAATKLQPSPRLQSARQ